tara:strand:+ start:1370 stop:2302 length:933 start_codon:yes stop_codon:yes gene_type:complete
MTKSGFLVIAAVAILTLLSLVYFALTIDSPEGTTTLVIEPPVSVIENSPTLAPNRPTATQPNSPLPQIRLQPQQEPASVAVTEPEIASLPEEVELVEPEPEVQPALESSDDEDMNLVELPSLTDSDSFVFESLRTLQNGMALIELLADDQVVRKFVVFVENISRGEFPQTGLPYKALGQEMPVREIDDNLFVMEQVAHSRFDQVVEVFVETDTEAASSIYRMFSPLFQQAYAEIGFRNVSFDETLRSAINNVLQTTNMQGPYQLVKPSVMYLYADSSIENLAEVHKQLLRIGPDNTSALKAKLREFLTQI